jgi:hypothetical protein
MNIFSIYNPERFLLVSLFFYAVFFQAKEAYPMYFLPACFFFSSARPIKNQPFSFYYVVPVWGNILSHQSLLTFS